MTVETDEGRSRFSGLEVRSIDYVPLSERHGPAHSSGSRCST